MVTSLFGKNAVHTLDDADQKRRKAAFMSLMTRAYLGQLMQGMADEWRAAARRWAASAEPVGLFDEAARVLTRATNRWAGVPLEEAGVPRRARATSC